MKSSIRQHIRSNVAGYVALVIFAMSGTAIALPGKNTVDSRDIINGQVKTRDLASAAVTTRKLATGAVGTDKVLDDSLTATDIADDDSLGSAEISQLRGGDIADNSLGGTDIAEGTLEQVPSALFGGFGRQSAVGTCDPETEAFVTCASVGFTTPARGRALVIARIRARVELDADIGFGFCRIGTAAAGPLPGTTAQMFPQNSSHAFDRVTLVGVTPVLNPGAHGFGIDCTQDSSAGAIRYDEAAVTAVMISPS